MKILFRFVGLLWVLMRVAGQGNGPLPRATPESQGVSSEVLLKFVEALDQRGGGVHSVMLVRRGSVVLEGWWAPYEAGSLHELYSLSKSFTSTAVGFAAAEGKLTIDDEVMGFFPGDAPASPSANLKSMRVRDLLTMSTGHQDETSASADKISPASFLAHPVPHKPGTHFKYNTPATFMLSAIVQKQTGQNVLDYLQSRLFSPLGIRGPTWSTNAGGISLGGYGLKVRTEDIAKFGQLYLQKGRWDDRPLLPESWVTMATSRQVSNGSNPKSDWDQGYGFQFWRCRNGAYRGDGAFGQYCIVFPEQDAVLAITSGLRDMQGVLDIVWTELLPNLNRKPIRKNNAAHVRLTEKLARLALPTPAAAAGVSAPAGVVGRRFVFPANDAGLTSIRIDAEGAGWVVTRSANGRETRMGCAVGRWQRVRGDFGPYVDVPMSVSGAWTAERTFTMAVAATETPFVQTLRLRFESDGVVLESESNVGFGATKGATLRGRLE